MQVAVELRSRTQYVPEMFARPETIATLQAVLPELPANDALILDMMMHIGFSPIPQMKSKSSMLNSTSRSSGCAEKMPEVE